MKRGYKCRVRSEKKDSIIETYPARDHEEGWPVKLGLLASADAIAASNGRSVVLLSVRSFSAETALLRSPPAFSKVCCRLDPDSLLAF